LIEAILKGVASAGTGTMTVAVFSKFPEISRAYLLTTQAIDQ